MEKMHDDGPGLLLGQDGGQPFGLLGPNGIHGAQFHFKHLTVEEQQGAEGLVLGGGGDVLLHGQVGEKGLNFRDSHLLWVSLAVEQDVALDPVHVGLFPSASSGQAVRIE